MSTSKNVVHSDAWLESGGCNSVSAEDETAARLALEIEKQRNQPLHSAEWLEGGGADSVDAESLIPFIER